MLEKGRKAGVESVESSDEESSSAEETGFSGALPFCFEAGKRGRRVNMRLWAIWGLEEDEDEGLDSRFGEAAAESWSWLGGREGLSFEPVESL